MLNLKQRREVYSTNKSRDCVLVCNLSIYLALYVERSNVMRTGM